MARDLSEEQLCILRSLTPEEKLRQAAVLYWGARKLKLAGLSSLNPEKSAEDLEAEVRKIFVYARD